MSDEMIIRHCAPTLAGIKTGSLFSCFFEDRKEMKNTIRQLNRIFSPKGLRVIPLRHRGKRALIYIFRPDDLEEDFSDCCICSLLRERGYNPESTAKCIVRLVERVKCSEEFPHEIGCFLGFPPDDIRGFIEKGCRFSKITGYWKVYGDEEKALETFKKYDICIRAYSHCLEKGWTLEKLAVSKNKDSDDINIKFY